ncbi:MAG TPA: hypothetical protein EYQ53_02545 [Candidatus Poseidoniales archaeon]|nr:MAG: hypothetical protein CXT69_06140 [Euryarchaeota archaeon]HIG03249.1 hypothetical protein [Candidatus Poseidoniales archaeon]HIK78503.1 hypothetical protein [Candidatus Poseidoniales archaeon]
MPEVSILPSIDHLFEASNTCYCCGFELAVDEQKTSELFCIICRPWAANFIVSSVRQYEPWQAHLLLENQQIFEDLTDMPALASCPINDADWAQIILALGGEITGFDVDLEMPSQDELMRFTINQIKEDRRVNSNEDWCNRRVRIRHSSIEPFRPLCTKILFSPGPINIDFYGLYIGEQHIVGGPLLPLLDALILKPALRQKAELGTTLSKLMNGDLHLAWEDFDNNIGDEKSRECFKRKMYQGLSLRNDWQVLPPFSVSDERGYKLLVHSPERNNNKSVFIQLPRDIRLLSAFLDIWKCQYSPHSSLLLRAALHTWANPEWAMEPFEGIADAPFMRSFQLLHSVVISNDNMIAKPDGIMVEGTSEQKWFISPALFNGAHGSNWAVENQTTFGQVCIHDESTRDFPLGDRLTSVVLAFADDLALATHVESVAMELVTATRELEPRNNPGQPLHYRGRNEDNRAYVIPPNRRRRHFGYNQYFYHVNEQIRVCRGVWVHYELDFEAVIHLLGPEDMENAEVISKRMDEQREIIKEQLTERNRICRGEI